jgi:hypothetical protein
MTMRTIGRTLRIPTAAAIAVLLGIVAGAISGCTDAPSRDGEPATQDGQESAVFQQHVAWERSEVDGVHHLFVHFTPTKGTFRKGQTLVFQIRLKQPCDSWRISGGFDALSETVRGSKTNTTEINVSTSSTPRPGEDVIIDVQGSVPPEIDQVAMAPREQ